MSDMNFLEKLLDGVDVEWKALGDVTNVLRGKRLTKSQLTEGAKFPVYHGGLEPLGYYLESNRPANTAMIINVGASAGTVGYSAVDFWSSDGCFCLEHNELLNNRFLYFALIGHQSFLRSRVRIAGIPTLDAVVVEKLEIPIPCPDNPKKSLEIQAEIVRILDSFTELTAELTARKKQYNYYRDQLLSFEEGDVEWKTLGDVTKKWYSGGTPTAGNPEYYDGGDIPWLRTQEVRFSDIESTEVKITQKALEKSAAKWIPANCVIIAISGATAGRSAINKIPLTTNQHCGCLEIDSTKALYRYVFHWVSFNHENIKALGQGARGDLNSSIIKGFALPIPYADDPEKSLAEQARIVAILDKFDALTASLPAGLPREIELRQKQYEYYRDQLLSFPKPEAPTVAQA